MQRKIRNVGGSNVITLPPYIIETLELKANDSVKIMVQNKKIIIEKERSE